MMISHRPVVVSVRRTRIVHPIINHSAWFTTSNSKFDPNDHPHPSREFERPQSKYNGSTKSGNPSTSVLRTDIPPESPRFVRVPVSAQSWRPIKSIVKGVLPVPKRLFEGTADSKSDRLIVDPVSLASRTLEPARSRDGKFQLEDVNGQRLGEKVVMAAAEWKSRSSAGRRSNLRSAVFELYKRAQKDEVERISREEEKKAVEEAARRVEEHPADKLTRPSVSSDILKLLLPKPTIPRSQRPDKIATRKRNYIAAQDRETARRRNGLRKLYVAASEFIVDSNHLDVVIDDVFGSETLPRMWGQYGRFSVWGVHTQDPTGDLARRAVKTGFTRLPPSRAIDERALSAARLEKVAENLSDDAWYRLAADQIAEKAAMSGSSEQDPTGA